MAYKDQKQYRLPGYNYVLPGAYFVTICAKERLDIFGEVVEEGGSILVSLSDIGQAVKDAVALIETKYPSLSLGKWQIMPDHVHLILHIGEDGLRSRNTPRRIPAEERSIHSLIPGSVSSIVNHLKGYVTKWAKANGYEGFGWQKRFNDRVIRDKEELRRIELYIENNPSKWFSERRDLSA